MSSKSYYAEIASMAEMRRRQTENARRRCKSLKRQIKAESSELLDKVEADTKVRGHTLEELTTCESRLQRTLEEVRRSSMHQRRLQASARAAFQQLNSIVPELYDTEDFVLEKPAITTLADLEEWEKRVNERLRLAQETLNRKLALLESARSAFQRVIILIPELYKPERYEISEPEIHSMADLAAWEKRINEHLILVQNTLTREEHDLVIGHYKAARKDLDLSGINLNDTGRARVLDVKAADRAKGTMVTCELISELEDAMLRDDFTDRLAALTLEVDDMLYDTRMIDLRTEANNELKAQRMRTEALEAAAAAWPEDDPKVMDIRRRANEARTRADVNDVKARVAEVLERRRHEENDRYIRNAVGEVLTEMGYDIGEGFAELERCGAAIIARKGRQKAHALRFQVNPETSSIFGRVVAVADTTEEEDVQAQKLMCPDVQGMAAGLREHGIEVKVRFSSGPGDAPLDHLGEARSIQKAAVQQHVATGQIRGEEETEHSKAEKMRQAAIAAAAAQQRQRQKQARQRATASRGRHV